MFQDHWLARGALYLLVQFLARRQEALVEAERMF